MFDRILVPLDGSELAEQALPVAITMARKTQARIYLLRSTVGMSLPTLPTEPAYVGPYGLYDWLPSDEVLRDIKGEAQGYLDDLSEKYALAKNRWETYVLNVDPASAIVDYAEDQEIDLIVMSSRGHSGLERWALGSVTERVLRQAPCPVFIVRDTSPMQRILIPLDGSELAEQVLAPALEVARLLDAKVTLLRVEQPSVPDQFAVMQLEQLERGLGEGLLHAAEARAENYLQSVRVRYRSANLPMETVVLVGRPGPVILEYAAQHDVGVIAMATHGRGGLRRWVYGSVTEKVLRATSRSLLIVRPPLEIEEVRGA